MPSAPAPSVSPTQLTPPLRRARSRALYSALLGECGEGLGLIDELARSASRSFLLERLDDASRIACDFPDDIRCLPTWLDSDRERTGTAYRQYLDERQNGACRRFFSCRSHALHFLRTVAPTKLVDGAWLYGVLRRWDDVRLAPLIRIYLEELGCGTASQNHVAIYRRLLASNGCDGPQALSDPHYTQGSIQLSLAHHAHEFLPEVIGFNLGYEQLPLHLPVTAYELAELDIDPAYFSLHVTVDNASSGHARKALEALVDMLPKGGGEADFMRRIALGYRLNHLGIGTVEAIESFDLERELVEVLAAKAEAGGDLHSDRCRIGGRSVTAWLSDRREAPALLACLESRGWIRRGLDPEESRFWRLLHDERAPMFGVFSGYEDQLLRDWIVAGSPASSDTPATPARTAAHARGASSRQSIAGPALRRHLASLQTMDDGPPADDAECRALEGRLLEASSKSEAMALLQCHLSPANHYKPAGLLATRLYAGMFDRSL